MLSPRRPAAVIVARRCASALLLGAALALLPGCLPHRPLTTPMQSVLDAVDPHQRCDTLLVLLPGAFDQPHDFVHAGFLKAVRERRIAADVLLLDAHTEYYMQHVVLDRLLNEVVRPARADGYRSIWFSGISLGGYGSLLFAKEHGDQLDGVFVMAAFLGRRDIPAQIARSGGLAHWQPDSATPDDPDRDLWLWLKGYARAPGGGPARSRSSAPALPRTGCRRTG